MCRPTLFTETPKVKSFHSNSNIYELRGVVISTERSSAALSSLKARLGSVSAPLWLFELVGERRSPCPPIIKFQVTDQSMDVKHRGSHTAHKCLSSYHRSCRSCNCNSTNTRTGRHSLLPFESKRKFFTIYLWRKFKYQLVYFRMKNKIWNPVAHTSTRNRYKPHSTLRIDQGPFEGPKNSHWWLFVSSAPSIF